MSNKTKIKYIHWHIRKDEKNILWAGLDRQESSVNTINEAVLNELNDILDYDCQALVFYSLKEKGFIAGADIDAFSKYSETEVENFIQLGQTVFNKLAGLSIPTIVLIEGFCLGGGCELALACRYRIITNQKESLIGLPEIQLGIIPAWGGIDRSIRLMGAFSALTRLLLSGKSVNAKQALALGLVDAIVPERQLDAAAVYYIQHQPAIRNARFSSRVIFKKIITKWVRFFLKKRVNPAHYPAPYVLLDVVENQAMKSLMAPKGTAQELIRVFYLKERLKHLADVSLENNIKHVHVVGAGSMGGDIAAVCALHGLKVTLYDMNFAAMGKALIRARKYFTLHCHESHVLQSTCDRFIVDFEGNGLKKADIIIEAIAENLKVKQIFFKMAEKVIKPTAILATNTSSLSVEAIAVVLENPERLIGLHFFNPATKMPLVEVIRAIKPVQSAELFSHIFSQTLAFVIQIGKLPVPVNDSPGFLVNRILMPYLIEGMKLFNEGVEPACIDEAARSFGMLMGPMELADTVGLDICLAVAENLSKNAAENSYVKCLQKKVTLGELGKKTGKGFFRYNQREKKLLFQFSRFKWRKYVSLDRENRVNKLIKPMINEAECCINEKIVEDKDLLDAAMIFGAGFPAFRGGPLRYIQDTSKCGVSLE